MSRQAPSPSSDLFSAAAEAVRRRGAPLADRMRPAALGEFVGQADILGTGRVLRRMIEAEQAAKAAREGGQSESVPEALPSLILWGPPGTGKTTLAHLIARAADAHFVSFSAVASGVKEARAVIAAARERLAYERRRTILFIDEIHRFNKAQQDAFLPSVEDGTISLLGATTENPSFEVNSALLSRTRVFVLKPLTPGEIGLLIDRAMADPERGMGAEKIDLRPEARRMLCELAGGDARGALNGLELAALIAPRNEQDTRAITAELVKEALQRNTILYDQSGEEHYNLISALHKSIRHSDPNAALYYLARMIEGGEDALYIARRLVRAASEDIGLADPQALVQAVAAKEAAHFVGYPECDAALAQATVYLACAPKSNAIYTAIGKAKAEVKDSGPLPVPLHLRNAPTALMKELGYGKGYEYDHDWPRKVSPQEALPEELAGRSFYAPGGLGFEKEMGKRMAYFEKVRARLRAGGDPSD